jgi:CDP-diacylglycerol---glycerol-3-phosphate 3-phosphatidyltransferase
MNLPNLITLARIPLMFVIAGLMYCDWLGAASLAFWLFIAAAVGDWLDGYIARTRGLVSNFGKLMDALTDKIMVMGLVVVLVDKHRLPVALALITLCREFLVTGVRMVAASKGVVVAADKGGKSKTVTQLIAIGFLLGAPMVGRDWAHFMQMNLEHFVEIVDKTGLVIFTFGTVLTVWSGWRYISRYAKLIFTDQ